MGRFNDLVNDAARASGQHAISRSSTSALPERDASLLRLNANESVYGPSPKAVAAMRAALESSHFYPDDDASGLRERLAQRHAIKPEQILVANGLTALLGVIARTCLRPGLNAVTSACSFISYSMVTSAVGARLVQTPLRDGGYDLEAILAAMDVETRVVFIANPNNPTGTLIDAVAMDRFLERVPAHVIVVLDEAYFDYASYFAVKRGVTYSRSIEYVRSERNVVVLRTFSKAHGLAGLRIGYGMGPAELMAYFAQVQDVFAVSAIAQTAALAALDDETHIRHAVEENALQVECIGREVAALDYQVIPTWANFLTFDVKQDARDFARKLRQEGVLVRPLTSWGAPTSIRVTLGTVEHNQFFLRALKK
jgi:histidinol-phosphate aminotransferase